MPGSRAPSEVLARVSCITSAVKAAVVACRVATVRQQPLTEIESPSPASLVTSGPRTVSRIASPWSSSASTVPSSSTMPVNIQSSLGGWRVRRSVERLAASWRRSARWSTSVDGARPAAVASAMVPMPRSADGAASRRPAARARRRRRPRRPARRAGTRPRACGPPSRNTCCRPRSCSSGQRLGAGRGSPGARSRPRSLNTRAAGVQVTQPHHGSQRLVGAAARRTRRARSARGSSVSTVPVPTSITSHWARSRWLSTRAALEVTQRLVPSAAALRPSSVVANFQVTKGRRAPSRTSRPG